MKIILLVLLTASFSAISAETGLKTKDLKNTEISSFDGDESMGTITKEQTEEMKRQLEAIKKKQQEAEEALIEMEKE